MVSWVSGWELRVLVVGNEGLEYSDERLLGSVWTSVTGTGLRSSIP